MVNMTAKSVKHFLPEAVIHCISLYKDKSTDYNDSEPLLPFITNHFRKTKYVNDTGKPQDHEDTTQTAGYAHVDNVKYFTEGYNLAFEIFKNEDQKVLVLAEDHFFTTGAVLRELTENDFSLAYAPWDHPSEKDANGSILCFRPRRVNHLFPIPEDGGQIIEHRLAQSLILKLPENELYKIKNRKRIDYFGDGMYTNSSADMRKALVEAGIL